jgi:hypothetical protein
VSVEPVDLFHFQRGPLDGPGTPFLFGDEIEGVERPAPVLADLLDRDSLAVLYAAKGIGKTYLALDMALCVANGFLWQGHMPGYGRVLYVVGEGIASMGPRVAAWNRAHSIDQTSASMMWLPRAIDLINDTWVDRIVTACQDDGLVLIVLDTFARMIPGADENSAKDVGNAVAALDRLREGTGACVLVIHHSGKNPAAGMRGSSALLGAADTVLHLTRERAGLTLGVEHQRRHASGATYQLRLVPQLDSLVVEAREHSTVTGEVSASARVLLNVLGSHPGGLGSGEWMDSAGIKHRTFHRRREELEEHGMIVNTGTKARPVWVVSPECHDATGVPASAMALGAEVGATVPPPLLRWHP